MNIRPNHVAAGCLLALLSATATAGTAAVTGPPLPQLKAYVAQPQWLLPIAPLRIADHVWQVGTAGITALLVKTDQGAVLLDAGMPQAAGLVLENLARLGVRPADLRLILHTHAHIDHAGAIAAVKRATGATLVSNAESEVLLETGDAHDLEFGDGMGFPPVRADRLVQDGEVVRLGSTAFTVWFTPGHTPGSMSWTWTDTRDGKPVRIAYADSLSAPGYTLVGNAGYPHLLDDFARSERTVRQLPCDLLVSPHPDQSGWDYANAANPHPHPTSCQAYADDAEAALAAQVRKQRVAAH